MEREKTECPKYKTQFPGRVVINCNLCGYDKEKDENKQRITRDN